MARLAQRDERHDVERADAPVHAAMRAHVDRREHGRGEGERRGLDGVGRAEEREHRAVMVGIGVDVGEPHARDAADGVGEALDDARGSRPSLTFGTHSRTGPVTRR